MASSPTGVAYQKTPMSPLPGSPSEERGGPEKISEASVVSQGSTTTRSSTAHDDEDAHLVPTAMDIRRLQKLKLEQEARLRQVGARVDMLKSQERRVWKDMTRTQKQQLNHQETQWRRQAKEADNLRRVCDQKNVEGHLREKVRQQRLRALECKDIYRLQKFQENKRLGEKVRQDSKKLMSALSDVREQTQQTKAMQVELRKQQRRQLKLKQELEQTRKEQCREDNNLLTYGELQESLQAMEITIMAAEREEMSAVQQLQNSQHFRQEALAQLEEIEARSRMEQLEMEKLEAMNGCDERITGGSVSSTSPGYRSGLAGSLSPRMLQSSPDGVSPRLGFRPPSRPASTGQLGLGSGAARRPGSASTRRSGTDLHGISEEGGEDEAQQ